MLEKHGNPRHTRFYDRKPVYVQNVRYKMYFARKSQFLCEKSVISYFCYYYESLNWWRRCIELLYILESVVILISQVLNPIEPGSFIHSCIYISSIKKLLFSKKGNHFQITCIFSFYTTAKQIAVELCYGAFVVVRL